MIYDLIIIGASATGMSAGVYAARAGLNFIIVSKNKGGNTANAGIVENYLGTISKSGLELSQDFEAHLNKYNPKIILGEVERINKKDNNFILKIDDEKYTSKAVIVATGARHRKLIIEGEEKFENKGISYCETCDGPIFKDKTVAVIGGGNSAIKAATSLSKIAKKVYVLNIENDFSVEKIYLEKIKNLSNIELIFKVKTEKFEGSNFLERIVYKNLDTGEKKILAIDGVFIYVGLIPNTELIGSDLKILNEKKEIIVDRFGKTKIEGLFAAGDVTDLPFRQISIAVGAGATAILSALEHIQKN
jgi:thioredoxin-disulfide reductase